MIRNRMQDILEEHLCDTQYGFRPSRSTSHAIYFTRRLQDISEKVQHENYFLRLGKGIWRGSALSFMDSIT